MLRHEKPLRIIRGRRDLALAIRWVLLEHEGEAMSIDMIYNELNREFNIMRTFGVTRQLMHFYARIAADQVIKEQVKTYNGTYKERRYIAEGGIIIEGNSGMQSPRPKHLPQQELSMEQTPNHPNRNKTRGKTTMHRMQQDDEMQGLRRFEKPVTTIQGRPDLKKAVIWAVKEYGTTETPEIKSIIMEEFRFSKRYEPSHQAITAYIREAEP